MVGVAGEATKGTLLRRKDAVAVCGFEGGGRGGPKGACGIPRGPKGAPGRVGGDLVKGSVIRTWMGPRLGSSKATHKIRHLSQPSL